MTVTRAPIRNLALAADSITATGNACLRREVLNYNEKRIWCVTNYDVEMHKFQFVVFCGLSPEKHYAMSYIPIEDFLKDPDKKGTIEEFTRASYKGLGYLRK